VETKDLSIEDVPMLRERVRAMIQAAVDELRLRTQNNT
jgi:hypothetical protein